MKTYEYLIVKMEPVFTDADTVEEILNQKGEAGYRYAGVQKLWTENDDGESIQRNFLLFEKAIEEEI